jgi:hypothetical protein
MTTTMICENTIFVLIKEAICKYKCSKLHCSIEEIVKLSQDLEELKKNNNFNTKIWNKKCKETLKIHCSGELNTIISYIMNRITDNSQK